MIERTSDFLQGPSTLRWQAALREAIRQPSQLLSMLQLDPSDDPYRNDGATASSDSKSSAELSSAFPLFVTREFAGRMQIGDWSDPLFMQVWLDPRETIQVPGFADDPVGDIASQRIPGLLQKYHGRVLLVTTGTCAIHCRYCFRRHYPYEEIPRGLRDWQPALDYIRSDNSIREVILSGGDPLTIVDATLSSLVDAIDSIPHVERLRIHTRLPIVLPQRVDSELIRWIEGTRLAIWFVLHTNHVREIDADVERAIDRLRSTRAMLLNQAVLLRGINDTVEAQAELCSRLIGLNVLPYYLHQLDPVRGAAHFEAEIDNGKRIIGELARLLPGYGVPKYVVERAGEASKTRIL